MTKLPSILEAQAPPRIVHNRKLSGTTILSMRILFDLIILIFCARDILNNLITVIEK